MVHKEFHKSLTEYALSSLTYVYVQYSFDYLFMRCQHSEVVHRTFLKRSMGQKVEKHGYKSNITPPSCYPPKTQKKAVWQEYTNGNGYVRESCKKAVYFIGL